ncbi:MAG: transcription elongation factor GreA [Fimbriimonas ginsengisoli]|uniref:Transcription elongation factor GreA n=1 Tax=Fimbriimonas ginsengisoli TaxID=1005039 RepID=A0A931PTU9_FIMGI|nr:transcription elongation factor GreA [Fimbriimonas ginsengisoli]
MANEILVTEEGYGKLKAELEDLKGPVRRRIADAIREAKGHGDLRENAAYHEARLNQRRNEQRVAELEKALQLAKIVSRPDTQGAHLGSHVTLLDLDLADEFAVKLVGSYEGDVAHDLISITSPLGGALIGKIAGDEVDVDTPGGKHRYRVIGLTQL